MTIKRIAAIFMSAAMIMCSASAAVPVLSESSVTVSAASSLTLSKGQMSLGLGETVKLTANQNVKWRTSATKILTVDQKGNVKAAGMGTAWITAKNSSGQEKSCKITVKKAPTWVSISKGTLTLGVGEEYTLSAGIASDAACAKRTFRTSNSSIVKMTKTDWTGSFKAVRPGTAWVTVRTYNGKEASCKITVKKAPTWVSISKKSMTMNVGQTATLSASVASDAGCAHRTFRTSNSSIVKMTKTDWTGSFKAVKPGTAWVTVRTYNGKEASCKITVVKNDWRTLYKNELKKLLREDSNLSYQKFDLLDINNDGTPELFVGTGGFRLACCYVYTCVNNKLYQFKPLSSYGDISYNMKKGYLSGSNGMHFGVIVGKVYKLNGTRLDEVFSSYSDRASYETADEWKAVYKINDKKVTKSEYQNQMSKMYTPESDWVFMQRRFDMNNSSIDYNIDNYR